MHPALRGARHEVAAARALASDARRRPEPLLAGAYENFGGTLGTDVAEATLTLEQTFELGGDRTARRAAAEADVSLVMAEAAIVQSDAEAATAEAFLDAWAAQERATRLREAVRDADAAVAAATERLRAGAAPAHEQMRARADRVLRQIEVDRAERDFALAREALARPWGMAAESLGALAMPEESAAEPPSWEALVAGLDAQPEMRRAAAIRVREEAALRAARARRIPDLTLAAGARHLSELSFTGFVATVSLPLPWLGATRGAVEAAASNRLAAVAHGDASAARQLIAARSARERLTASRASRQALREQALPAAEGAVRSLAAGFRAGRFSYLEVHAAQRGLLEAQLLDVELTAEIWKARIELERWTTTPTGLVETPGGAR
jgi:cobalt-zinc-cadmium efflux system outer membrane protein